MAALDFPSSPALNQIFAAGNGVTYKWDGDHWVTIATSSSFLPLGGGTLTGALIVDTPTSSNNIIIGSFTDDASYNAISLNGTTVGSGMAGLLGGGASGELYVVAPTGHSITFRVGGVDMALINGTAVQAQTNLIASGGDLLSYRYGTNATPIIRATAISDDAYAPPFLSMWRTSGTNTGAPAGSTLGAVRFEGLGSDNGYAYWGGLSCDMIGANAVNGGKSDIQMWANLGGNSQPMMRWSGANQNIVAYYAMLGITPAGSAVGTEVVTAAWVKGLVAASTYDSTSTLMSDAGTMSTLSGNTPIQITHGVQVFSRSFTAVDAARNIEVDITLPMGAGGVTITVAGALFIDGAANAVAQGQHVVGSTFAGAPLRIFWRGVLAAGAHTFSVRFGSFAPGAWLNGANGAALGGGAMKSTMTIREVL